MKLSTYLKHFQKDFFTACGYLMVVALIFLSLYSQAIFDTTLLWQIMLAALTFTFFKFAFVNQYGLDDQAQMMSYFISALLGDITLSLLLTFFTPGGGHTWGAFMGLVLVFVVMKMMVYPMMYKNAKEQAKALNEKLLHYNGGKHQ